MLARLGRHKEALAELRQVTDWKSPLLEYYARLFIGRSAAALGDDAAARAAFDAASRISPAAQSPLLALSQLAHAAANSTPRHRRWRVSLRCAMAPFQTATPGGPMPCRRGATFETSKADLVARVGEAMPR